MTNTNSDSRVWFITGASSGFGRALAEHVLARGDRLVATARNRAALEELAATAPARVLSLALDVARAADIEAAVAAALAHFGAIDVLVNNAGYGVVGAVEETTDAELRLAFDTMFFGAVALARAVLPHMRERRRGTIVSVSSMGGIISGPGIGAYCAAKHALEAVSEALASEVRPLGIRVLVVEPGAFRTRFFGGAFRTMPALEAYTPTVGPMRSMNALAGTAPGDPAKAARAIFDTVTADTSALRLPLGGDSVDAIRAKLARVAADVDRTEAVARATAFD